MSGRREGKSFLWSIFLFSIILFILTFRIWRKGGSPLNSFLINAPGHWKISRIWPEKLHFSKSEEKIVCSDWLNMMLLVPQTSLNVYVAILSRRGRRFVFFCSNSTGGLMLSRQASYNSYLLHLTLILSRCLCEIQTRPTYLTTYVPTKHFTITAFHAERTNRVVGKTVHDV